MVSTILTTSCSVQPIKMHAWMTHLQRCLEVHTAVQLCLVVVVCRAVWVHVAVYCCGGFGGQLYWMLSKTFSMSHHAIAAWYSVSFLNFAVTDMVHIRTCMSSSGWKEEFLRSFISLSIEDIVKSIAPCVLLLLQLEDPRIELSLDCGTV